LGNTTDVWLIPPLYIAMRVEAAGTAGMKPKILNRYEGDHHETFCHSQKSNISDSLLAGRVQS
jgi:hypothetical protein